MARLSAAASQVLRRVLEHPLAARISPDDPVAPSVHRILIRQKPILRDVYEEWYRALSGAVGELRPVLEIGSGAGYLAEFIPGLIASDVRPTPASRVVLDAHTLPFSDAALGGIVMTNVLHHLPAVSSFFDEAARVVRPGGVIAVIEPWTSPWSEWVYRSLHHEPFDPGADSWEFAASGPMSSANGALPWILFERDRARFEQRHPEWRVEQVRAGWPLRYLVSGGVSMRNLAPPGTRGLLRRIDRALPPKRFAMFALAILRRELCGARPDAASSRVRL